VGPEIDTFALIRGPAHTRGRRATPVGPAADCDCSSATREPVGSVPDGPEKLSCQPVRRPVDRRPGLAFGDEPMAPVGHLAVGAVAGFPVEL